MLASLRRKTRHAVYYLRGGFVVRPFVVSFALGTVGALLPLCEERWPSIDRVARRLKVLAPQDVASAQAMLTTIASALVTVVSIVLSVLLVALTLASVQFSPRILSAFVRDRVSQHTIGLFVGSFLYCLAIYPTAENAQGEVASAAVLIAIALALLCVASLLLFVHHIARSINASYIADRIARETEQVIDEELREPVRGALALIADPPVLGAGSPLAATTSGYVRFVDANRLLSLAHAHRVVLRVERRVGQFVSEGVPLVTIVSRKQLSASDHTEILSSFDIGPMRTLEQDVEFGVLQLVDIALKAISPAVNDPSTAINCIDQLGRVLRLVATRRPGEAMLYRPPGVLRVVRPNVSFERLLETGFGQIRAYGRADLPVMLRLLSALGEVADGTGEPRYLKAIEAQGARIFGDATRALPEEDRAALRTRYEKLRGAIEHARETAAAVPEVSGG